MPNAPETTKPQARVAGSTARRSPAPRQAQTPFARACDLFMGAKDRSSVCVSLQWDGCCPLRSRRGLGHRCYLLPWKASQDSNLVFDPVSLSCGRDGRDGEGCFRLSPCHTCDLSSKRIQMAAAHVVALLLLLGTYAKHSYRGLKGT